jgi:ABC-type glycerol-3-phosphate transport system permease component
VVWSNYADIFNMWPFFTYLWNTVLVTSLNILGAVLSSSLVAYSFARLRWRYRDALFVLCLATMMLPPQVTLVPTFILFVKLGWLDSFLPLIVPAFFAQPFNVFLLRQFFRGVPRSLEDAALVDGCGYFRIYRQIILPLAKPALLTVTIFTFIMVWNDFMGPLIYISSEHKRTLALALAFFSQTFFAGVHTHHLMAASLITMTPCILVFIVFQRYFIRGIVFSGMKG